jgi:hypothetical protein
VKTVQIVTRSGHELKFDTEAEISVWLTVLHPKKSRYLNVYPKGGGTLILDREAIDFVQIWEAEQEADDAH